MSYAVHWFRINRSADSLSLRYAAECRGGLGKICVKYFLEFKYYSLPVK